MARKAYAKRYAQAVFEIAREADSLEKWLSDLQEIAEMVGNEDILAFLTNAKVPFSERSKLISGYMEGVDPLALNLIYLIMSKGRLELLADILDEYRQLLDRNQGVEHAKVLTAIPLEDKEREIVINSLEQVAGKKLVVDARVDPTLIGGIIARIDGKLLDGSTRNKLNALKKDIAETAR